LMPREVASSSPAITQMGWPHLPPPIGGPNGPRSGRHVGRLGEGVGSGAANPDASALCGARLGALRIRAGARRSPRQGAGAGEGKAGTRDSRSAWARCGPTRGRRLRDPGRRGSAQRLHQAALGVRRVAQLLAGLGQGRSARPPPPEARERGPGEGARRGSQGRSARPPRARERGPGEGARRGSHGRPALVSRRPSRGARRSSGAGAGGEPGRRLGAPRSLAAARNIPGGGYVTGRPPTIYNGLFSLCWAAWAGQLGWAGVQAFLAAAWLAWQAAWTTFRGLI
jgi:hypothetical protein